MAKAPAFPKDPPEHLSEDAAEVWREVVERGMIARNVDVVMLEAYCSLVVRWRETAKALADDGMVIDGGKGPIVHPALTAERQLSAQLKDWGPLFSRPPAAVRKRGPLYDATRKSIDGAPELAADRYAGPILAALTLAWLIDEAQRAGLEALQKASFVMIPSYLKACAELQITPASVPAELLKKAESGGKVDKFQRSAADRRLQAV